MEKDRFYEASLGKLWLYKDTILQKFVLDSWFTPGTAANYGLEVKKYCKIVPETQEIILGLYIRSPEVLPGEKNSILQDICFFDYMTMSCSAIIDEIVKKRNLRDSMDVKISRKNVIFPLYKRRLLRFFPVWYYPKKDYGRIYTYVTGFTQYIREKDLGIIEGDCIQYYKEDCDELRWESKLKILERIAFGTRKTLKWNGRVVDI